jgi:outer membrane protein
MTALRLAPLSVSPLALALCAALAAPVQAQNLLSIYETARNYDAAYQSAKSQFDATMALSEEAKANILPTVNLGINGSNGQANVIESTLVPPDQCGAL